jgi:uncharacterized short protein YbdD (DUF466 family)
MLAHKLAQLLAEMSDFDASWRNYLRKCRNLAQDWHKLAQLLAENVGILSNVGAMLAQCWRNVGAMLAQLLAENVGIWRKFGASLAQLLAEKSDFDKYLLKMRQNAARLAQLLAEMSDFDKYLLKMLYIIKSK